MSYLSTLINLLLPEKCLGCGRNGAYLCDNCLARAAPAEPIEDLNALACFDYHDQRIKKALWLLKYRGVTSLAPLFARLLHDRLIDQLAEETVIRPGLGVAWLLIPIPLARERERERGYNQSALIAKYLAKLAPKHLELAENILIKTKCTPTQVSIKNRRARLANLKDAFALAHLEAKPPSIVGRRVILLDDVITTGGTMRAAIHTLLRAGAKSVLGIAIAHG